jgi:DNA excision repair protein ERCC-2
MAQVTARSKEPKEGANVRISVRDLAEFVHRTGGLSSLEYSGLTAQDGSRTHRLFFKEMERRHGEDVLTVEVGVKGDFDASGLVLRITGRADAVLEEHGTRTVLEAKSVSADLAGLPDGGEAVHWAQALLYAHLLDVAPDAPSPVRRVALVYVSADTLEYREFTRPVDSALLERFFRDTASVYCDWAKRLESHRTLRDASLLALAFPYGSIRPGQKRFMQETLGAIRRGTALLVQAPTGTGKTISALFPAVKSLPRSYCNRIFYLTAKTSTRFSAEKALDDLRARGMVLKSVTLTAKEKLCLCPEVYCDPSRCRYALGYFDRIRTALTELHAHDSIRREEVLAVAEVHSVCPFELSLDISLACDVIIADYNYVFDPRIRLERFFGEDSTGFALLVDEAHNLPERSRAMYSAGLTSNRLSAARRAAVGQDPVIARCLGSIARYFLTLKEAFQAEGPGISDVEPGIDAKEVVSMGTFRATRRKPDALATMLLRTVAICRDPVEAMPSGRARRSLQEFLFEAYFFLRVLEEFFDGSYVTTAESGPEGYSVRLMCLDASRRVRDTYLDRHAAVFFSATLSPPDYFAGLLCGPRSEDRPEKLILSSPFPEENLLLLSVENVSTKYAARASSLPVVASYVLSAVSQRVGNYLVYLPSFDYLRSVSSAFRSLLRGKAELATDVLLQSPGMDEAKREAFLERFSSFGQRTLVAFAVLGGVFGEGIDLVGEKLTGVVVVGVGLPQLCGEREVMKDYYATTFGSGFEFAYMYPGFNKVQQAAGRLIRSDSDRGFILLVDERYGKPEYRQVFPDEWHPIEASSPKEVAQRVREFFEDV